MPLYTVVAQEDSLSTETKAKIAAEITRIHSTVMSVPRNFVRVVFLSYLAGSGYTAGTAAPTAAINCTADTLTDRAITTFISRWRLR